MAIHTYVEKIFEDKEKLGKILGLDRDWSHTIGNLIIEYEMRLEEHTYNTQEEYNKNKIILERLRDIKGSLISLTSGLEIDILSLVPTRTYLSTVEMLLGDIVDIKGMIKACPTGHIVLDDGCDHLISSAKDKLALVNKILVRMVTYNHH